MDFFKHQDQARKKTWLLIFLFVLAVILIVLAVNVITFMIFSTGDDFASRADHWLNNTYWEHPTAAVVLLIFFGSLNRYIALSDGGKAVAEMVNAKPVDMASKDMNEKKYINIVSEMSIASGLPMPSLYLMNHEKGINAFVAGYSPTEAVMVVTMGALEELNRDELQGVVAHEFSHILNGDMRINIRLIAILAGILTIGQFGKVIMRSASNGHGKRNSGPLVLIGLVFFLIGYIGLFFGRLIKAAISRQREYLADASSVQFTRNPQGIAGALFKIRESIYGGHLVSNRAEEMSHMCFASSLSTFFESLLATHPDIDMRINTIDPLFLKTQRAKAIIKKRNVESKSNKLSSHETLSHVVNSIGNPGIDHLTYGALVYKSMPELLMLLAHTAQGAQAIVYAFIVSGMNNEQGFDLLSKNLSKEMVDLTAKAAKLLVGLDRMHRLPMIDLILPVLKCLNNEERMVFSRTIDQLVKMDQKITLFEFVLLAIINQHLDEKSGKITRVKYYSFRHVLEEVGVLLSVIVQSSQQSNENNNAVFARVTAAFSAEELEMVALKECSFQLISNALNKLNHLAPMLKRSLITSCADCVVNDGIVMPDEAELLRAVSERLECPMPPLMQL